MAKERGVDPAAAAARLPGKIVELLASPRLTDIPENPVGRILRQLCEAYPEFTERSLPEIVDVAGAIVNDAMYVKPCELHHVDANKILRYDLTLPMLLTVRHEGQPLRVWSSGKTYRVCEADATHLEAFHQLEVLWLDDREKLDQWRLTGRVLGSVDRALPGRSVKIVPVQYPMCARVGARGRRERRVAGGACLGCLHGPDRGSARRRSGAARREGVGYGLERFAMLRYGIDDIRKIDVARVA